MLHVIFRANFPQKPTMTYKVFIPYKNYYCLYLRLIYTRQENDCVDKKMILNFKENYTLKL